MTSASFRALLLIPVFAGSLPAQVTMTATKWASLVLSTQDGVDLRSSLLTTNQGNFVQIKNFGTQAIHFGYLFPTLQTPVQAASNGRIHLKPGGGANIPVVSFPGSIQILTICLGNQDSGTVWQGD